MIFKGTQVIRPTRLNGRRNFLTSGHKVLISLLLTALLSVNCARPNLTELNPNSPLVYVAVGDSTGIGLGARDGGGYVDRLYARIKQRRSDTTLINLSVAGATTADAVNKQLPRLNDTRPTLVTICIGVNDLLHGREAKQFAGDYEALIAKLKQPGRLLVAANLPDVAAAPAVQGMADESFRLRLRQFNQAIEAVAKRHGVPLVDLYRLSGETTGARPEFFSTDGLHPSDLGYARWAEAMWAVVEREVKTLSV